jgi:predicted lipoprotein with Yx(FWY)xxD motif
MPVYLYRWHLGWLLGQRFLLLTHIGHRTTMATHQELPPHNAMEVLSGYEHRNRVAGWLIRRTISSLVGWRYDATVECRQPVDTTTPAYPIPAGDVTAATTRVDKLEAVNAGPERIGESRYSTGTHQHDAGLVRGLESGPGAQSRSKRHRSRSAVSRSAPRDRSRHSRRMTGLALSALLVLFVVASCGESSPAPPSTAPPPSAPGAKTNNTDRVDSVYLSQVKGTVLVNSSGYPLYVFAPDKKRAVTCTGACAAVWPPLKVVPGAAPTAGAGVDQKLLGVDENPPGGQVVTYNGWPLYTYATDLKLGMASAVATGQGLDLNGGYWYVMLTSGSPVVRPLPPKT